ncbi:Bardet-Biedl syndrome 7 protein [Papilio xuthus]|uniref:Bardet-Biedl syndrome 7 protein n=1 Tax=Papilio xuthus TaxID=66420 RepID=A0A194Q979_PAPXU|nr:Bardet-Biedl syndrome 7 protein [Papilio xuthus]
MMEYDLARIDYILCGITFPDTLKILPNPGHKTLQKFAVGDKNGVLQCLCIKDEEPIVQFKTLPGKPITSIQVASTNGNHIDKIFAASGHEVKGYTRKGKVFLTIETSVSETITSMCILNSDLVLCSGRTVTFYRDLKEIYTYACEDRVLDIAAFSTPNSTRVRLLVLIGNKGAAVIENGELLARTQISSGPTRLIVPPAQRSSEVTVFYGAADGSIGLIQYETDLSSTCLVEGGGLGAVVCVGWYFSNGAHLAVGRHDGSVQLYLVDLDNVNEKPRLKFTYFCGEPITSVCGGSVGTEETELLVSTFSGRVFALRSQRLISGGVALNNMTPEALASRRNKLELEVARLEKQTAAEREKYQRNTRSLNAGMSTPPLLEIQYELTGAMLNGWQEVIITAGVPLDMLFIYCNKKVEVQTDSAAVLSVCPPQGKASEILATVRCQAGTRRIWLQMRAVVDCGPEMTECTQVLVYVLPAGAPRIARLIKLSLPALPQYSQHDDPDRDDDRVWCELRLSGGFSVAEMTSWLSDALPGELPRPAVSISFARVHCLLKTVIICRYQSFDWLIRKKSFRRGSAVFKSDNVSTIATLKDLLSYCSLKRAIRVDISCDIPEMCCLMLFKSIKDQFLSEYQRKKEFILKEAIGALDLDVNIINSESEPILCEEYVRVWKSVDTTKNTLFFNELAATVEQWYSDWCKLSLYGRDNSSQKTQLKLALQECQVNNIEGILSLKDLQINSNM